jgi:hypothetical protein
VRREPEAAAGMLDRISPHPEAHAACIIKGLLLSAIGMPAALIGTYEFFYRASSD